MQSSRNSFRVAGEIIRFFATQGFKANPGLELANAFSVIVRLCVFTQFGSAGMLKTTVVNETISTKRSVASGAYAFGSVIPVDIHLLAWLFS